MPTPVTKLVANVIGVKVPAVLTSFRYKVGAVWENAVSVGDNTLLLDDDFPTATNKAYSYARDPSQWYVAETVVTSIAGIEITHTQPPSTGASDTSPNIPRNPTSGKFDKVNLYLVPAPLIPPIQPTPPPAP